MADSAEISGKDKCMTNSHVRGPSTARKGSELRSMQLVTTQGPQDEDAEDLCRSKEEELCHGHQRAGHEEEEQCRGR